MNARDLNLDEVDRQIVLATQAGLPLVPAGKRERARLAAQALMATVVESARRQPG